MHKAKIPFTQVCRRRTCLPRSATPQLATIALVLVTGAIACDTPAPIASPALPPAGQQAGAAELPNTASPTADTPLTITRSWCAEAGCELTFTFSHPMVPEPRKGRSDAVSVAFTPPQPGRFTWKSQTELIFTPGPQALQWGHEITVTVSAATSVSGQKLAAPWSETFQVPYFQAAGKVASWPVIPGRPRFVALLNGRSGQLGAGPIYLLYDQPIVPAEIGRLSRLSYGDKALPLAASRPTDIGHVYSDTVDTRFIVALRAESLPADGEAVTLQYPKLLDGRVPEISTQELTVKTEFAFQGMEDNSEAGRMPLEASLRLLFSAPISAAAVKEALTITPEPEHFSVSWVWGQEAYVIAQLQPGVSYRMTLSADMRDELGNRLGKRHLMSFMAHDLPPFLSLPDEPITLEAGKGQVPIRATNTAALSARVWSYASSAAFVRALGTPPKSCDNAGAGASPARTFAVAPGSARNMAATYEAAMPESGLLCLEVEAPGVGSRAGGAPLRRALLVQTTNLGITAKVHPGGLVAWVTRLGDAMPQANARVALISQSGQTLASASTDDSGVARLTNAAAAVRGGLAERIYLVVEAGSERAALALEDQRLSQPWQLGVRGDVRDAADLSAAVFTDRGVYRPDETVHIKAIVRDAATGRLPAQGALTLTVTDPRGKVVLDKQPSLDLFGTVAADLKLAKSAGVGVYQVRIAQGDHVTTRSFAVEEYRIPTFEVTVDSTEDWSAAAARTAGVHATITARYMHGGDLIGRPIQYTVARERIPFAPAAFPGFVFAKSSADWPDLAQPDGELARGSSRLDGASRLSVHFTPSHPATMGPMRYVVDATVTDVDRQAYRGRLARVVHPASYYIGVRPVSHGLWAAGDTIEVPVAAVTPQGQAKPGVPVSLWLERVDYHTTARLQAQSSVALENRPVPEIVSRCQVRTGKGAVLCRFLIPRAGTYRVVAQARDDARQLIETGFGFTASGSHTIAWPRYEHERIDIVRDRVSYEPGDTARLMVQSPFAKARGLLTIERGDIIEHKLFEISGDAPAIAVPIKDVHAPNIFASIVLIQPRVHAEKDAIGFETGAPSFRLGYTEIPVRPRAHALDVRLTAPKTAQPGEAIEIDLEVTDHLGLPTSGQATVMVVDEAVLALTGYKTPDPVAEIFAQRPLGVRTATNILDLPHSRRSRHEQIFVSGDGGQGFSLSDLAGQMRSLFQSTAYWNPDVRLGPDGRAKVRATLPDNVTTYRIMAIITAKPSAKGAPVGSAHSRVVARKPLMVAPILPRFVYPGDTLRVEAHVFNGTGEQGKVRVRAAFAGMALAENHGDAVSLEVAAGRDATAAFPIAVTGHGEARVQLVAQMGNYRDAVDVTIPILSPGVRRREVIQETVSGERTLAITLPSERVADTAEIEIALSQTRLSQLKDALEYLMDYPNGCIEQTTSRAYPLLVLEDLLPEMGVTVDPKQLRGYAEAGVKRLLSFQTSAGGLSYWPGDDTPHAFGTVFGLSALIEAKKRGYDVPDPALARMADYLEESLRQGKITDEMPHGSMADADTRALFVMTLGRVGRPQPGYISALWQERAKLTAFGLAFLAVAAAEQRPDDRALAEAMLAEVRLKAKEEAQEAYYEGDRAGGWSMDSPLRTHAGALVAFAQVAPKSAMAAKLLAGLLSRQQGGLWGNTQENVYGIMGVAALLGKGESSGSAMEILVNGTAAPDLEPMGPSGKRLRLPASALAGTPGQDATQHIVVKTRSATPTFVTLRASYQVALSPRTMAAQSHGFAVSRSLEDISGAPVDPTGLALGSLVRVKVKVTADTKRNYVAIVDQLPAGLEALNTNLANTENASSGALSDAIQQGLRVLSYSEARDSRVAFYANDMPAGTYEFVYLARATTPGRFLRPAATAEAMYDPDASGASTIDHVHIR